MAEESKTTWSPSFSLGTHRSAGVEPATLETMTGTPWSAPPFTLKPNLPCESGRMVTVTMPVEEPLDKLTSLASSSGRGEEDFELSSLTVRGSGGERGRTRAVEA